MSSDPRSSARAAVLATALAFEPTPIDPFALLRVPAIVLRIARYESRVARCERKRCPRSRRKGGR